MNTLADCKAVLSQVVKHRNMDIKSKTKWNIGCSIICNVLLSRGALIAAKRLTMVRGIYYPFRGEQLQMHKKVIDRAIKDLQVYTTITWEMTDISG